MPLCCAYPWHLAEQYLQSPLQLEHACEFIFDSELFVFHSERMCEILTDEAAVVCILHHSCAFNKLMSSRSEHRSSRSVHAVQHFTLLWPTQPKLPPLTQAVAIVDSLAHGSRSRRHGPRCRGHVFRLNVHLRPKHRLEGFGHPHRGEAAFASRAAPIRSLSVVQVVNCGP